ncbi:hypothetical protein ACFQH6_15010 [Halobacteriaceae archaeon GCM10025711]
MARINIEVAKSTKRDWMDFVEKHDEYSSLTHLINLSVNHEIREQEGERPRGGNSDSGAVAANTEGMERQMESMQASIAELADTVDRLELSNSNQLSKDHIKQLMHEAIGYLPSIPRDGSLAELTQITAQSPEERARQSGNVEDIASAMGVDTFDIEVALSRAERDVPHVKVTREDGTRRYYQVQ